MVSVETLVIVYRNDEVLLGLKGRNFGKGKWNGFGGKLQEGESLEGCARRETFEEVGIELGSLRKAGKTDYVFEGDEQDHEVHVYVADYFEGYPRRSDEMHAWKWFGRDEIPYDANEGSMGRGMWHNDRFWMRYLLDGEDFEAKVFMTEDYVTTSCVVNGKEFVE